MPLTRTAVGSGLDAVRLDHASGASCTATLYGAHITSWKSRASTEDNLFLSGHAVLDGTKAIRGGIPLVFPQFGPGKLPNHGFARTSTWALDETCEEGGTQDAVSARFVLSQSDATLALWPHAFELRYTITLFESSLRTSLEVENTGKDPFDFQALLHTYFKVPAIESLRVGGLSAVRYADKLKDGAVKEEQADQIEIEAETDRIYKNAPDELVLKLGEGPGEFRIRKGASVAGAKASSDAVLWNPWVAKSERMGDFGNQEFRQMVCVEPGIVSRSQRLESGEIATLSQALEAANIAAAI